MMRGLYISPRPRRRVRAFESSLKRGGALRYHNGPMPRQLANLFNSNPPMTEGLTRARYTSRKDTRAR
jgi:hypothetical protein